VTFWIVDGWFPASATDGGGSLTIHLHSLPRAGSVRASHAQTDTWGVTVTQTWDAGNNLVGIVDSLGGTTTLTNDAAGRLTDLKYSDTSTNALSVKYQYDAAASGKGVRTLF
jgi:YD repeat-containing protein